MTAALIVAGLLVGVVAGLLAGRLGRRRRTRTLGELRAQLAASRRRTAELEAREPGTVTVGPDSERGAGAEARPSPAGPAPSADTGEAPAVDAGEAPAVDAAAGRPAPDGRDRPDEHDQGDDADGRDGPDQHDGPTVTALWALARLDLDLQQRRLARVSTAVEAGGTVGLLTALEEEVVRLREEMGVPGSLEHRLDTEPSPAAALLLVHSVRVTLDQVARHSQGYDLTVRGADQVVTATVVCDDFDGDRGRDADLAAVAEAIAPAGARLGVDEDRDGRLRVRVTVPTG